MPRTFRRISRGSVPRFSMSSVCTPGSTSTIGATARTLQNRVQGSRARRAGEGQRASLLFSDRLGARDVRFDQSAISAGRRITVALHLVAKQGYGLAAPQLHGEQILFCAERHISGAGAITG